MEQDSTITAAPWGDTLSLTGLATSMAVNTLMTGLIVFKILKAFLEVKRTLGPFSSAAGRPNYQHIAFIIIESGMGLFAAHLARILTTILLEMQSYVTSDTSELEFLNLDFAFPFIIFFHQMFNVVISSVHFYSFVLLIIFTWLGHRTNNNIGASLNGIVLR